MNGFWNGCKPSEHGHVSAVLDMDQPIHNIPLLASNVPVGQPSFDPYLVLNLLLRSSSSSALRRVVDARHSSVCRLEARVPEDTCLSAATLGLDPTLDASRSLIANVVCSRFIVLLFVSPSAPSVARCVTPFHRPVSGTIITHNKTPPSPMRPKPIIIFITKEDSPSWI
jgi:hypothetical protein